MNSVSFAISLIIALARRDEKNKQISSEKQEPNAKSHAREHEMLTWHAKWSVFWIYLTYPLGLKSS